MHGRASIPGRKDERRTAKGRIGRVGVGSHPLGDAFDLIKGRIGRAH